MSYDKLPKGIPVITPGELLSWKGWWWKVEQAGETNNGDYGLMLILHSETTGAMKKRLAGTKKNDPKA